MPDEAQPGLAGDESNFGGYNMKKIAIALAVVFALTLVAGAQKKMKPWTEWSDKDIKKILDDSPWGQTQNETNTS